MHIRWGCHLFGLSGNMQMIIPHLLCFFTTNSLYLLTTSIMMVRLSTNKDYATKDRVDTIYYDMNWNGVSHKAFANYYRKLCNLSCHSKII